MDDICLGKANAISHHSNIPPMLFKALYPSLKPKLANFPSIIFGGLLAGNLG